MVIDLDTWVVPLLLAIAAGPALQGLLLLTWAKPGTGTRARLAVWHSALGCLASWAVLAAFLGHPEAAWEHSLPTWLHLREEHWQPRLLVDRLSVLYLLLVGLVYPVVVRFSLPSFHREPGADRYWFLVSLLASALWLLCLAGNLETLFVAWELVGVASVLLIGFFHRQVRAAQNSLRALVYYRLGDFLILVAAVLIHHTFRDHRFRHYEADLATPHAVLIGMALLGGSLAKSAQLPMSPWLHRAMEGPAASSAIFYGALSVHLGPFLLLRTSDLWLHEPAVRWTMAGIGFATAGFATLVGRTRADAKTALAYATMAQIGIMYCELAAGWQVLVAVHLFAHAGLRTWQFLRSSSLIQDFQDNPVYAGGLLLRRKLFVEHLLPERLQRRLYLAAVRMFWIDGLQWHWLAAPVLGVATALVRAERWLLRRSPRDGGSA